MREKQITIKKGIKVDIKIKLNYILMDDIKKIKKIIKNKIYCNQKIKNQI
jgi:hypothetical protein